MIIKTATNPLLITASELFLQLSETGQEKAIDCLTNLLASEQRVSAAPAKDHGKEQ